MASKRLQNVPYKSRNIMVIRHSIVMFFVVLGVISISSCNGKTEISPKTTSLDVFVSIPPQAYFVRRIGGDLVSIHVLVSKGQEPHTFEPNPRQMRTLAKSKLFFEIGMPFERQLVGRIRANKRHPQIVNTAENVPHLHDPHIWLSPPMIEQQARTMAKALETIDPSNANTYRTNLQTFISDLDKVDRQIRQLLSPYRGRSILVFHPAFGCFCKTYGIHQKTIQAEGKSPSPKQLLALIKTSRAENIKVIFVEPQFDPRSAQIIAKAIGGSVVTVDPLDENVLDNLIDIAKQIQLALSSQ